MDTYHITRYLLLKSVSVMIFKKQYAVNFNSFQIICTNMCSNYVTTSGIVEKDCAWYSYDEDKQFNWSLELACQLTASSLMLFMYYCHFVCFLWLHLLTSDSDFSLTEFLSPPHFFACPKSGASGLRSSCIIFNFSFFCTIWSLVWRSESLN